MATILGFLAMTCGVVALVFILVSMAIDSINRKFSVNGNSNGGPAAPVASERRETRRWAN